MSARKNESHGEYLARRREKSKELAHKEKKREQARIYRLRNPEKVKQRNREYYAKYPGARGRLKRDYGITPERYDEMLAEQGGVCAACGGSQRDGRPLCVDHCHRTKVVRGLLCDSCNICAGHIESSRFDKVVAYLARQQRPGWDCWGNETDKFDPVDDFAKSLDVAYETIRERKAAGGPGWEPK